MQEYKESIDNVITAFRSIGTELSLKKYANIAIWKNKSIIDY